MRGSILLSLLLPIVSAGCDLFPEEPPSAQIHDASNEAARPDASVSDGGEDALDGIAGDGGAGGASGHAGMGGVGGSAGAGGESAVVVAIDDGTDDVNEDGPDYQQSRSRVWLGTGDNKDASYVGFRFSNVTVPEGAIIRSARLLIYLPIQQTNAISVRFDAEAHDDCDPYSIDDPPSSRSRTQAWLDIVPGEEWLAKTAIALDGMGPIVAEVIERPGWHSGNALCLVGKGAGDANVRRRLSSFDGEPANAPRLEIVYAM